MLRNAINRLPKELSLCHKIYDFLFPLSLWPDGVKLWYYKLRLFNFTKFIIWNIYGRQNWVAKIKQTPELVNSMVDEFIYYEFIWIWYKVAKNRVFQIIYHFLINSNYGFANCVQFSAVSNIIEFVEFRRCI